ncbi:alpha amylase catalytic region [Kosmotoga olearia TBF 19.5.1]|uniref:Alpha amylase catalytic region n=1 Tax=Kosmotoga olearia (strain ATCC BAA-1733 / DSM 21960 / TBF 19.5.1) TaxID=521045 RepID=C5CIL2_KOSOT|nr:alpha amylase catalytic region [Kosmotoga olearia TBF 19.5.1]
MKEPWWKGAVIYQVYPRSFKDSNNDGIGDLKGVSSKLDYIADLGVDAIWLSPIYKSPMKDFGYDISDYYAIDPIFGTMEDFDELLEEAHKRGLKVILDMVLNHTSDQHPWFIESRSSRDNPKADWYIWVDGEKGTPPNNWQSYFGGSAWNWDETRKQYYLCLFTKEQPDLNWRNPEVKKAVFDVVRFWLEKGVDGFRLDVVNLYYKDAKLRNNPRKKRRTEIEFENYYNIFTRDRPETLLAVEELQEIVDSFGDRVTIGEVATDLGVIQYYEYTKPGRLNLAFNFEFKDVNIFSARAFGDVIDLTERIFGEVAWPSYVLGNHDSPRFISRFSNGKDDVQRARVLAAMLLTVRGTPFLYAGEEIGMTEGDIPYEKLQDPLGVNLWPKHKGRDGCRTPMQWDDSEFAGFSTVEPWLPVNENKNEVNVEHEARDPNSMLNYYKELLRLRKESNALKFGDYRKLETSNTEVLAYLREYEDERKIVILNFNDQEVGLELKGTDFKGFSVQFGTHRQEGILSLELTLAPLEIIIGEVLGP